METFIIVCLAIVLVSLVMTAILAWRAPLVDFDDDGTNFRFNKETGKWERTE